MKSVQHWNASDWCGVWLEFDGVIVNKVFTASLKQQSYHYGTFMRLWQQENTTPANDIWSPPPAQCITSVCKIKAPRTYQCPTVHQPSTMQPQYCETWPQTLHVDALHLYHLALSEQLANVLGSNHRSTTPQANFLTIQNPTDVAWMRTRFTTAASHASRYVHKNTLAEKLVCPPWFVGHGASIVPSKAALTK